MLQSKFKPGVFFPLIASFVLFAVLIWTVYFFIQRSDLVIIPIITFPVCFFFLAWLIRGELRTKAMKITIENDRVSVRNYLGYGAKKEFWFEELDGYKIALLPSEYRDYEYVYLIKDGRKVVTISEYYHQNFQELKSAIAKKCKALPKERFNLWNEIKLVWTK